MGEQDKNVLDRIQPLIVLARRFQWREWDIDQKRHEAMLRCLNYCFQAWKRERGIYPRSGDGEIETLKGFMDKALLEWHDAVDLHWVDNIRFAEEAGRMLGELDREMRETQEHERAEANEAGLEAVRQKMKEIEQEERRQNKRGRYE